MGISNFDIVVVGGGPVGVGFALAAKALAVAVVAHQRRAAARSDELDSRVYTLSPGNVSFLQEIGAWQAIPSERLTPVYAMRVFGDRDGAEIRFDAYRAGVRELAWTVEDGLLQDAMWRTLDAAKNVKTFAPAECESLVVDAGRVCFTLRDGRELASRLVVGADGAHSFVRERAGIPITAGDYGQEAVVANFDCEKPHANTAYQWFQGGPVLALLPLPGRRVSMVWALPSEEARKRVSKEPRVLSSEVQKSSGNILGALSLATPARSYPLRRLSARRMVGPRLALTGDAAHVIHPLAGQGLNLGLQDARSLAKILAEREPVRDAGDLRLLRRYERDRAEAILAMDALVDGLFGLFGARGALAVRLRNAGLNLADAIPVLKNVLMRQAIS